ncbi:MAG: hypothetical protein JRG80_06660, partial [Deltaproteobacteria bacterium]|nr:hypothetical protein [Deltaproteobacteria bacterium]
LGRCIACVEFPSHASDCVDALLTADCVVAYGSDETMAAIRSRIPPSRRLVEYGHRLSVAVIDPTQLSDAELGDAAGRLALDIAVWDQLGCLSPIAAFVIDPDGNAVTRFAERIAEPLADLAVRLPRGRTDPAASALASHERAEAEMRAAAGAQVVVYTGQAGGWSVIAESDATARPAPLHRFIRIQPVLNRDALPAACPPRCCRCRGTWPRSGSLVSAAPPAKPPAPLPSSAPRESARSAACSLPRSHGDTTTAGFSRPSPAWQAWRTRPERRGRGEKFPAARPRFRVG